MSEQYELDIGERQRDPKKVLQKKIAKKLAARKYRKKHRDSIRKKVRRRWKDMSNIKKYSDLNTPYLKERIRQCKKRTDCSLTPKELLELIPKDLRCPIFKTKFKFGGVKKSDKIYCLSIDRIDNKRGYHKDNVVIVSMRANTMKSTGTVKEMYMVADFYYELEKK